MSKINLFSDTNFIHDTSENKLLNSDNKRDQSPFLTNSCLSTSSLLSYDECIDHLELFEYNVISYEQKSDEWLKVNLF